MIEKFLTQTSFSSEEDFAKNFHLHAEDDFNFAYDVMDEWAKTHPDKQALLWTNDKGESKRLTFADVKEQSDKTAAYFHSLGIGKGDMVLIILKRRLEFWLTMLALHKIGAVAIPATHLLTANDIIYRNNSAKVKAIICVGDEYVVKNVAASVAESPTVETLISVGPEVPEGFHDFHAEWLQAPEFTPTKNNKITDTMLVYFTSGTSGEPKMVAHNYGYALGHLATGVYWHNLTMDSIHLTIADTGWGKAVWGKLYGQWFAGATVFVYDHEKFHAADILKKIEEYKITSFCAPPTIYRFMLEEDFSKYDLSSLKYCCTAGEALNASVFEEFKKLTGLQIMEAYGQTETTLIIGTFPWIKPRPGSLGKPNPQYEMDIVDEEGNSCPPYETGEIVVKIEHGRPFGLFKDYALEPERTKYIWRGGMYHTCDIAYKDDEGYYWFVGRNDDIIKSSGYRISPFEVESAILKHPATVECAVTAVPDDIRGNIVKATIVLSKQWDGPTGEELVKDIQNFVKHETAPYKYPRVVEFVDELPKTISGKIRRVVIRERDKTK